MSLFRAEFFNRSFGFIGNTLVEQSEYNEDYLSPQPNSGLMYDYYEVSKGDYIRLVSGANEIFGVVKSVSDETEKEVQITYEPFLSLFDFSILFDTDLQDVAGTGNNPSLEQTLANIITEYCINNIDTHQNIPGLSVQTTSTTMNWGFNLKSDTENMHRCIINFYDVLIKKALTNYGVSISVTPNIQNQTIVLSIGTNNSIPYTIETDLPNIISKSITIKETTNDVNKLVVYNTETYGTPIVFYRHSDDSYNNTNTDRVTPVVCDREAVTPDHTDDILLNWDFSNPENTSELDSWTGLKTETIDNWGIDSGGTLSLVDDHLRAVLTNASVYLRQTIENPTSYAGKKLTVMIRATSAKRIAFGVQTNLGYDLYVTGNSPNGDYIHTFTLSSSITSLDICIGSYASNTTMDIYVAHVLVGEKDAFRIAADAQAVQTFGSISYNNLIELEVVNDDSLVLLSGINIGQTANIISEGVSYNSMLTGKSVGRTTVLTFGTIRLDLTKIIK